MDDFIIKEDYTLPSKGRVYSKSVDPNISIRSMTTEEEMKRLGKSELPYKMLSEIIDDCLVKKPGISVYDMIVADYQFLLYKLRTVTYGSEYSFKTVCPVCGSIIKQSINLDNLPVSEYSEDYEKYLNITLPRSKKQIKLRMQTPRMFDEIHSRVKDLQKRSSEQIKGEPAFLFTLQSVIETVDGEALNPIKLDTFVRHLPMQDANYIIKSLDKINIGLNTEIDCHCDKCNADFKQILPITGEFFGPAIK